MFVLFFQDCDSSVVKANCTIPWLQQLQNQEHCNCVMLFHWLSEEDLSLQERHRALQHAWPLWQRWIMQLSSRCLCPRLERITATCHLGVPSWTQLGSVERETSRKRGQSWSDWILPSAPELHEEQTEKHWQIWQMLKELLWSCYETAMELLTRHNKTQLSIQLWDPTVALQVLPLYRFERIVSWNVPGGRSGLRRTQSIWHLDARNKTAAFLGNPDHILHPFWN